MGGPREMLFLASRVLEHEPNDEERLRLLVKLQERNFVPLVRSTRLSCYRQSLPDENQAEEMERLIASLVNSEGPSQYVQGELFCFDDHVLFLLFEGLASTIKGIRAGIVYERQTAEPLRKLDSFCQTISLCLANDDEQANSVREDDAMKLTLWRQNGSAIHQGFLRFISRQDTEALSTIVCRENDAERVRAAEALEDDYTRLFLSRAKEAYAEGFPMNPSAGELTAPSEFTANKLLAVGLLRREVLINCRASGHTLFSLPSADALAVMTISHAWCSVCGAAIADEKIEEVFAPTRLASALLEDGAWLVNRLHALLRGFGIPESEIVIEPPAGDGEARMMARVCEEMFLIVMRDGNLTPAFARRAINTKIETDARHLVVVVTGTIHNEGRMSLLNFAKRLERGGSDFEMIIAEGANAAAAELQRAFGRVSQRALAEQLCELDASLGVNVARFINARFQMLHHHSSGSAHTSLPLSLEHISTKLLT
ncbi:MAG TPA: hypothetical protein VGC89_15045 [Pyrinomonadaceae bacterium]